MKWNCYSAVSLMTVILIINITTDNSLREIKGVAREFITKPVIKEKAIEIHDGLYNTGKGLTWSAKEECKNDRCSIHVHVNVSDLDEAKVREFILLYALLEPLFFEMVDESRRNNIFCVPLSFTFLNKYYPSKDVEYLIEKWASGSYKYTAFNIIPLGKQGSIEFRHLQGTDDNKLFSNWLEAIHRLYKLNLSTALKNDVLDPQWALWAAKTVFDGLLPSIDSSLINNTYYDVKLALLDPEKNKVIERIKAANLESTI